LPFFAESLNKWSTQFHLDNYEEYIQNKETSKEMLQAIFAEYENYGICGAISLLAGLNIG